MKSITLLLYLATATTQALDFNYSRVTPPNLDPTHGVSTFQIQAIAPGGDILVSYSYRINPSTWDSISGLVVLDSSGHTIKARIPLPATPNLSPGLSIINDKDHVLGSYSLNGNTVPFYYHDGVLDKSPLPNGYSPIAMNNKDQIVGTFTGYCRSGGSLIEAGSQIFLYSGGVMNTIKTPAPCYRDQLAYGITDDGLVIGAYMTATSPHSYAFYHDGNRIIKRLNLAGSSEGPMWHSPISRNGFIAMDYQTRSAQVMFCLASPSDKKCKNVGIPGDDASPLFVSDTGKVLGSYSSINPGPSGQSESGSFIYQDGDLFKLPSNSPFGITGMDASGNVYGTATEKVNGIYTTSLIIGR